MTRGPSGRNLVRVIGRAALRRIRPKSQGSSKPLSPLKQLVEQFGHPQVNTVELVHWTPGGGHGLQNFGDYLSSVITTKILADAGLFLSQAVARPARLLAIGSILHMAKDGDTIWGAGVGGKVPPERYQFTRLDVRAVRGPRTREFLLERGIDAPEVYGDPALLVGHLMPRWHGRKKTRPYVFVPNMWDLPLTRGWPNVISPLLPWNVCFHAITSSEMIVASSLHGLIVAEAYGIPARYVRLTDEEPLIKYEDYLWGTGRRTLEFARSVEEGLEMGGMPPPTVDVSRLLSAFPFDLWNEEFPG
jgi:pyruvyltransferase